MQFSWVHGVLLAAFFLPLICAAIAKWGRADFDNHHPRAWEAQLTGYRARAVAAMNNSFEALPFFATAVLVAYQTGASHRAIDGLALLWLGLRVVYVGLYLADRAMVRSVVWLAALAVTVWVFLLGV